MKTLSAVVIAASLGAAPLWAHEKGAAHADLILGQPPEYLHMLLHPVLIVGLALALATLIAGLVTRSKITQVIALSLVLVCSATAWPVLGLGQNAYNRIRPQADEAGQAWASEHMRRAETFVYVFYATALLAGVGMLAHRKWPKAVEPITVAVLIAGASSLGVGGWISKAGGQIRHPEFRQSPPPTTVQSEHTHEHTKP